MFVTFFRVLWLAWPFFKSVLFNDRPVSEVLNANRHFTALFIISFVLSFVLFFTLRTLGEIKDELVVAETTVARLERRLSEVKPAIEDDQCRPSEYDKDHLLELLEDL